MGKKHIVHRKWQISTRFWSHPAWSEWQPEGCFFVQICTWLTVESLNLNQQSRVFQPCKAGAGHRRRPRYTKAQVTRRGVALNAEHLCIYNTTSETITYKKRSIVQDQREKETMEHLLSSRARRCEAGEVLRLAMQVKMEVWRLCKG